MEETTDPLGLDEIFEPLGLTEGILEDGLLVFNEALEVVVFAAVVLALVVLGALVFVAVVLALVGLVALFFARFSFAAGLLLSSKESSYRASLVWKVLSPWAIW